MSWRRPAGRRHGSADGMGARRPEPRAAVDGSRHLDGGGVGLSYP